MLRGELRLRPAEVLEVELQRARQEGAVAVGTLGFVENLKEGKVNIVFGREQKKPRRSLLSRASV